MVVQWPCIRCIFSANSRRGHRSCPRLWQREDIILRLLALPQCVIPVPVCGQLPQQPITSAGPTSICGSRPIKSHFYYRLSNIIVAQRRFHTAPLFTFIGNSICGVLARQRLSVIYVLPRPSNRYIVNSIASLSRTYIAGLSFVSP